jgi:hypothetical protein
MYSGGTFQLQGHTTGQAVYVHGSANRLLQDTTGDESCDSVITVRLDHETPDRKIELIVKIRPDQSSENHEY